jgi:hypothetical protein
LKVRFQADADLRRPIIAGLRRREPTIDFRTAHDVHPHLDWSLLNVKVWMSCIESATPEHMPTWLQKRPPRSHRF